MSTMPGNLHADAAQPIYSSHQTHEQVQESLVYTQREATLALAFEQRTANLIAVAVATFADGSAMFPGQIDSVRRQIADRLGMGGPSFVPECAVREELDQIEKEAEL